MDAAILLTLESHAFSAKRRADQDTRQTVLVVDDERDIVNPMRDFLEAAGYAVVAALNGTEAMQVLEAHPVQCVLLDVMMPGASGFDILREVRTRNDVPVLFLSARSEDSDKIRGLALATDDYIVTSATPTGIVARVQAVLRRYGATANVRQPRIDYGDFTVDLQAREVCADGVPVSLTAREFDLLKLFMEHPRQVLARDQIFERLWGPYGDRHTMTVHIGRLREKLEPDPANREHRCSRSGDRWRGWNGASPTHQNSGRVTSTWRWTRQM